MVLYLGQLELMTGLEPERSAKLSVSSPEQISRK